MNEARNRAEELRTQTNQSSELVGNHLKQVKALRTQVAKAEGIEKETLTAELGTAEEVFNTELARYKSLRKELGEAVEASIKLTPEEEAELAGYFEKYAGKQ